MNNSFEIDYDIENLINDIECFVKKGISESQKRSYRKYQITHPEKMRLKSQRHDAKIKANPEAYGRMLEMKRKYYQNVIKPRNELLKCQ